jgi:hypothetical protein
MTLRWTEFGFGFLFTLLLFGQFFAETADAKLPHGNYGNFEQTVAVFTMIALAIAGFGILLAIYSRETESIKPR